LTLKDITKKPLPIALLCYYVKASLFIQYKVIFYPPSSQTLLCRAYLTIEEKPTSASWLWGGRRFMKNFYVK
jgi:hypothetical protein